MTTCIEKARPFVKWVGGKQALAPRLTQLFPKQYSRVYEPFVGGGSVFFTLAPQNAVLGDQNDWLLDAYRAIRDDWEKVASILDGMENSKEAFLQYRSVNPKSLERNERAALFIYLNKTCFRGLFRVNKKGQFNVPYGAYDRRYYDPKNLKRISEVLQGVTFRHGDFERTLHDVTSNDFIYLDPPYYKFGGHSDFNRYTEGQFREADHFRLAAVCRELDTMGVRWALSNSNTAFVRHLFDGFRFLEIDNRREINLNSKNRNIKELLVMNY